MWVVLLAVGHRSLTGQSASCVTLSTLCASHGHAKKQRLPAHHADEETSAHQLIPMIATDAGALDSQNLLAVHRAEWKKRTRPA